MTSFCMNLRRCHLHAAAGLYYIAELIEEYTLVSAHAMLTNMVLVLRLTQLCTAIHKKSVSDNERVCLRS